VAPKGQCLPGALCFQQTTVFFAEIADVAGGAALDTKYLHCVWLVLVLVLVLMLMLMLVLVFVVV
jgi:hypothetical protein